MLLFCGLHCGVPSSLFLTTIFVLVLWHKTLTQLKIDSFILHCLMPQRRSSNMRDGLVSTSVSMPSTFVLSSTHGLPSSSPIKSPPNGREVLALKNGRFENFAFSNTAKYYFCSAYTNFCYSKQSVFVMHIYSVHYFCYRLTKHFLSFSSSLWKFEH